MHRSSAFVFIFIILLLSGSPPAHALSDSYLEGFRAYKVQDYDGAVDHFKRAIVENPENFMAYWWLANTYMEKRLYSKARNIVSIADRIKLKPPEFSADVFNDRRRLMGNEQDYYRRKQEAADYYHQARQAVMEGRWSDGLNLIRQATGANPLEARYWTLQGDIHHDLEEPRDALDMYRRAALLEPRDAVILQRVADTERELGDKTALLETLRKLNRLQPAEELLIEIRSLADAALPRATHRILRREGNRVFLDIGYRHGLRFGDEFKTKLRVTRQDPARAVRDRETGEAIVALPAEDVGDVMITRIEEKAAEGLIVREYNSGIRSGDEVLWRTTRNL